MKAHFSLSRAGEGAEGRERVGGASEANTLRVAHFLSPALSPKEGRG
jgi:hypothetical protein